MDYHDVSGHADWIQVGTRVHVHYHESADALDLGSHRKDTGESISWAFRASRGLAGEVIEVVRLDIDADPNAHVDADPRARHHYRHGKLVRKVVVRFDGVEGLVSFDGYQGTCYLRPFADHAWWAQWPQCRQDCCFKEAL